MSTPGSNESRSGTGWQGPAETVTGAMGLFGGIFPDLREVSVLCTGALALEKTERLWITVCQSSGTVGLGIQLYNCTTVSSACQ